MMIRTLIYWTNLLSKMKLSKFSKFSEKIVNDLNFEFMLL